MAPKRTPPRNAIVLAMVKRYLATTKAMKDRRMPRGGARDKQRDCLEGRY